MLPSRAPSRRRPSRPSPYLPYPRPLTRPSHLSILTNRLTSHLPRSPRRRFLLLFAVLFVAHVLFGYGQRDVRRLFPSFFGDGSGEIDEPPTWVALRRCQANLPQHNLDLPAPEGRHGRYVYFGNEIKKLGWNNCLNEVLMNTHLANLSNRTYVFQPYTWKRSYYPWPWYKHRTFRPTTPLPALLSGPTAGAPWPSSSSPRSVSLDFFNEVCPPAVRRIILSEDVKKNIRWESGDVIFETWRKLLSDAPERCIEIRPARLSVDPFPQVFDLYVWGSERILPLWQAFKDSEVSRGLRASPVVMGAVARNMYLFEPTSSRDTTEGNTFSQTLALHLRRGDFLKACADLARWNSTFYSWNLLPFLPDPFVPPPGGKWGENTEENIATYSDRCYPSEEAVIEKVKEARDEFLRKRQNMNTLDTLFILTNAPPHALAPLRAQFLADGWTNIVTTRDLVLDAEAKEVGMAVDMEIARRAAVFVGNGWSSFTSNIVHRRLVDGKEPISIRFM